MGKAATKTKTPSGKMKNPPAAASKAAPATAPDSDATRTWTFLTNHSHVLIVLYAQPDLVLREVAARVGITERAVQRIVQDLEEEGFVRRQRVGRRNQYEVITDMPLRHPIESHRTIGDVIELIAGSGVPS